MNHEIEENIIEYLQTQEDALKKNDLMEVYDNLVHFKHSIGIPNLTTFLKEHGIEPLDYFNWEIPHHYASRSKCYSDLKIPTVHFIGNFAFDGSDIKSLYIPSSVANIGICAFRGCDYLKTIYIDGCPHFDKDAFHWLSSDIDFKMNCTKIQFMRVNYNIPQFKEDNLYEGIYIQFLK